MGNRVFAGILTLMAAVGLSQAALAQRSGDEEQGLAVRQSFGSGTVSLGVKQDKSGLVIELANDLKIISTTSS